MATKIALQLGWLSITPAANAVIPVDIFAEALFQRHSWGDWGEVCAEDWAANDRARDNGDGARILSVYRTPGPDSVRFWIITEADRSATTVLLPSDY